MTPRNPLMLLVDDDPVIRDVVGRIASDEGFEVVCCASGRDALDALDRRPVFALVDLRMPEVDGLEVLRALAERMPSCGTALMSGAGTIDEAVAAIKLGAVDYLHKPLDFDRLRELLGRVRADAATRRSLLELEGDVARRLEFCGMIGRSAIMQEIFSLIRRLAPHVRNVLITGETGTGKELVAKAFHALGPRRDQTFVPVNCSAVVDTLSESELFGHARGAFTGATENKVGLFERADRGRCSWMRSANCRCPCRRSSCASSRAARYNAWAAWIGGAWTCTCSRRPIAICAPRWRRGGSGRTSCIASTSSNSRCRPCGTGARTSCTWWRLSFVSSPRAWANPSPASRRMPNGHWSARTGKGNVREMRNVLERACVLAEGTSSRRAIWSDCRPGPPATLRRHRLSRPRRGP